MTTRNKQSRLSGALGSRATNQIEVSADTEGDLNAWDGWVHSRIRLLIKQIEDYVAARPWPQTLKGPPSEVR